MTLYHGLQLLLLGAIVPLVVERIRTLFFEAPVDARPVLRVVRAALSEGNRDRVRAMVEAGRPAWVLRLVGAVLDGDEAGDDPQAVLDEELSELRYQATRRLDGLRVLGSVASASGMFGAVLELIWYFQGDHGLAGLKAGLPEELAFERALLSVVIGFTLAGACLLTLRPLRAQARRLRADLSRAERALEAALGLSDEGEAPANDGAAAATAREPPAT